MGTLLQGRSSPWLPAAHNTRHRDGPVLVTNIESPTERGPRHALPRPSPNPTAAGPDGRRVLSRVGVADHEVTPKAPWTGSGWRENSYGGFGEATNISTGMRLAELNLVDWDYQLGNWTDHGR